MNSRRDDNETRNSKYLSYILRHHPESIGLTLDEDGWANIDALIAGAASAGRQFNRESIKQIVTNNDKKRFGLSEDGQRIRAVQGHSNQQVNLQYEEKEPPQLYHGTATRFLKSIQAQGLIAGSRHKVHLSADKETAVKVGQRHGTPVVLRIDTEGMRRQGLRFYLAENGVWLVDNVPSEFISTL